MPETFLRNEFHPHQQDLLWFPQDGANAHTARNSLGSCFREVISLVSGTSPGPPARLTLQYQATSTGATSKARYKKHVLPILLTQNREFLSVFKGSPRKCYNVLLQPCHRDCRSVLNDVVVAYRVSCTTSNDPEEFSQTRNAPDSVNEIFPLFLKKLFHFKNRQVLLTPNGMFRINLSSKDRIFVGCEENPLYIETTGVAAPTDIESTHIYTHIYIHVLCIVQK